MSDVFGLLAGKWKNRKAGLPPGTLTVDPEAHTTTVRAFAYGPDNFIEKETLDLNEVEGLLHEWPVVWLDVVGLGDVEVVRKIGELFHLHRLALEDVTNVPQRPKIEPYEDHYFKVMRLVQKRENLYTEQISLFFGSNFVITFCERPSELLTPVRERLRAGRGRMRSGADYLAYVILDLVIDTFYPLLETFEDEIDELEDHVLTTRSRTIGNEIHQLKKQIIIARRAIAPLREEIIKLLGEDDELLQAETQVHLRDCLDHAAQISERLESHREVTAGLMDLHLTHVSNRMNDVMKVLTLIATIFIPLSFIAGIYGMNFDPAASPLNMPETKWFFGYPFALALMAVVAIVFLIYFHRKGWLSSDQPKDDDDE